MYFDIRQIKNLKLDASTALKSLYEYAEKANKNQATVGKIVNGQYTTDYNKWCTAEFVDFKDFTEQVDTVRLVCQNLINQEFKVNCLEHEIHFLHYKTGTKYNPHIDGQYILEGVAKRGVDRDITAVVYLNDDYDGGEITFNFFDLTIRPTSGNVLIYPSTWQFTHGVNEVKGNRYAIVFWFKTDPPLNVDSVIPDANTARFLQHLISY